MCVRRCGYVCEWCGCAGVVCTSVIFLYLSRRCKRANDRVSEVKYPMLCWEGSDSPLVLGKLKRIKSLQPKPLEEEIARSLGGCVCVCVCVCVCGIVTGTYHIDTLTAPHSSPLPHTSSTSTPSHIHLHSLTHSPPLPHIIYIPPLPHTSSLPSPLPPPNTSFTSTPSHIHLHSLTSSPPPLTHHPLHPSHTIHLHPLTERSKKRKRADDVGSAKKKQFVLASHTNNKPDSSDSEVVGDSTQS